MDANDASRNVLAGLPPRVGERLDELTATLRQTLGDELVSMLLYGSAVRGGFREGTSDVDAMLVLREAKRTLLEAIGNALRLARNAARIETMIVLAAEIPRAADVYPLLYDDIRACHAVLVGTDPFAAIVISEQHRRLRIEQELRDAQIRMRRVIADAGGATDALVAAMGRKLKQVRSPLHALMHLRGTPCAEGLDAVLAATSRVYALDLAPLSRMREVPLEAYDAFSALLAAAVNDVDAREGVAEKR